MQTLTINIKNETLTEKVLWMLEHFKSDGLEKVIVDISFKYTFKEDSKDFIDYSEIAKIVKRTIKKEKFLLIEDAIITINKIIYNKFKLNNLKIKITKPEILKDCIVSVSN